MQKNPIAVEAIGFFCSIGKLVLVEGFRQVGQIVFSWQRGECLSHGRDEPLGGGGVPVGVFFFFECTTHNSLLFLVTKLVISELPTAM